jgi:hypothetical protein
MFASPALVFRAPLSKSTVSAASSRSDSSHGTSNSSCVIKLQFSRSIGCKRRSALAANGEARTHWGETGVPQGSRNRKFGSRTGNSRLERELRAGRRIWRIF